MGSALCEEAEIGLRGGVLPHVDVHGGGKDDGSGGGEVEGGEEVGGEAVREAGHETGGARGDGESVDALPCGDVLDVERLSVVACGDADGSFAGGVPERGEDFVAGEGGEGERGDEAAGGAGHGDLDGCAADLESADEFGGLVGGDAAAYAEEDLHSAAPGMVPGADE